MHKEQDGRTKCGMEERARKKKGGSKKKKNKMSRNYLLTDAFVLLVKAGEGFQKVWKRVDQVAS